jgi:hypothetical protein
MTYAPQTLVSLLAFLLIGLTACGPEKDPELINTMITEADSVQINLDAVGNAKQRIGGIMMTLQALNPTQRDTLKEKLAAFESKIQDALNTFRNTPMPEADSLTSFRQAIADYEKGLLKKKQAEEKLEIFRQAVSGVKEKAAALNEKVASVESELPNVLPIDGGVPTLFSRGAAPADAGGAQTAPSSSGVPGGAASGSSVPERQGTSPTSPSLTTPSPTSPSQTGGTLTAPQKKQ